MTHLRKGEIEGFLAGRLEAASRRRVVRHLLDGCSLCRRRMKTVAAPLLAEDPWTVAPPVAEDLYDEALTRVRKGSRSWETRWRKETAKLARALALLNQSPDGVLADLPARQVMALHGWPLSEALLQKSAEARFRDPQRMLALADRAARMAESTPPARYPWPGFVFDLRARAFAELGNAYRLNERFADAEAALERASCALEEGSGDPLVVAQVLDLSASLRSSQRRLHDAVGLLDRVHDIFLEAGDPHLAGRALISKGINVHYLGRSIEAVGILEKGLRLLEAGRDPQLVSIGRQALLHALADCGEHRRASRLLLESGLRKAFAEEPLNLLKVKGVEGKIHAGLGRPERAERAFSEVREEFLKRGQFYDAALVGLELAALWLRQGRAREVRELAEEMHETFEDLGVQREAQRALYFVREACRHQAVTAPMIERIRGFLERLPWHPGLRFEPELFVP